MNIKALQDQMDRIQDGIAHCQLCMTSDRLCSICKGEQKRYDALYSEVHGISLQELEEIRNRDDDHGGDEPTRHPHVHHWADLENSQQDVEEPSVPYVYANEPDDLPF